MAGGVSRSGVVFDIPGESAEVSAPEEVQRLAEEPRLFGFPPVVWLIVLLVGGYIGLRWLME